MEPEQQLRNLKDFLLVYNRMTESCFQRCSSNFNYRSLTMDEERCVDNCAGKLIRSNHRLMATYVQLMPRMVQRRMEEMESKAAEMAKAAEAATPSTSVEDSTVSQSPSISEIPAVLPTPVTDVGLATNGSISTGLDVPLGLDAAVSKSTTAAEVAFSAATPLTPATEAVNLPALNIMDNLTSHTVGLPELPVTESGVSAPVFTPSKPVSLPSEDMPVSIVPATTVSSQERAPEVSPPPVPAPTITTNNIKPDE